MDSWLEMGYTGECVTVSRAGSLMLQNCMPGHENQSFTLTTNGHLYCGKVKVCYRELTDGMRYIQTSNCLKPVQFRLSIWSGIPVPQTTVPVDADTRDPYESRFLVTFKFNRTWPVCLGSAKKQVSLRNCHQDRSSIFVLNRKFIERERRALLLPIPSNSSCDYPACGVNSVQPGPVLLLPEAHRRHCSHLTECLTIICKTARRPLLVLRMLRAARDTLGYDLPAVVYDDGPEGYGQKIREALAEFPLLEYVIGDREAGASRGRNRAVEHVKTRFFVILDDDMELDERSDLRLAVDILDKTDASVVGGSLNNRVWAGTLQFTRDKKNKRTLLHTFNTCMDQPIPGFPECFKCDITAMFLVAKRADYLSVGGFSEELMTVEHPDFFLNLKADSRKCVNCPKMAVAHNKNGIKKLYNSTAYNLLRYRRIARFVQVKKHHWNVENIIGC